MKQSKVTPKPKSSSSKTKLSAKELHQQRGKKKKRLLKQIYSLTDLLKLKELPGYTSISLKVLKAKIKQKIIKLKTNLAKLSLTK